MTDTAAALAAWTCPFCPLACGHLGVGAGAPTQPLVLRGGDCPRASCALSGFASQPGVGDDGSTQTAGQTAAQINGQPCTPEAAIAAAVSILAASRQPLFAGLGTDVAGARALYPLACATGAICDAAEGDALMQSLRALQDRGQFTTTLAEVRTRADVIVFVGGLPIAEAPLIGQRCGMGEAQVPQRHVVVLGPRAGDEDVLAGWAGAGVTVETVALEGDLFTTLSWLQALLAQRALPAAPEALQALAQRLRAARYAVLVGTPALLPAHGALLIEAVHNLVGQLNQRTRAAALWVGGGGGAATANQVFTWLSGLPLRTRCGPRGLEHEPYLHGATRLLSTGAVDTLLWVSSFDAQAGPPETQLPLVVLGPPGMAAACQRPGVVFIAVATPGIGCDGHVFRTDGTELLPLWAVRPDGLPTVADVALRVQQGVLALRQGAPT